MYDGVKAMIKREKELMDELNPPKPIEVLKQKPQLGSNIYAGSHLKNPSDIKGFVEFPQDCKSLLSKYMTK